MIRNLDGRTNGNGGGPALAAKRHRLVIPALQLAHLAWFGATLDGGYNAFALAVSGVASAALYAWFVIAEYRWNGYRPSPILFYLGASVLRLGAGALFVVVAVDAGERNFLTVGQVDITDYLMQGHWLALLGDWCVVAGYFVVASRIRSRPFSMDAVAPDLWPRVWMAGLAASAGSVALRVLEPRFGLDGLGRLPAFVTDYGVAAGVCLMLAAAMNSGQGGPSWLRAGVALVFLALDLVDGLYSYMKSDILVAALPLVLLATHRRARKRLSERLFRRRVGAAVLLAACFVLFVVAAYSPPRRDAMRLAGAGEAPALRYDVPVAPFLLDALRSAVPGTGRFAETHRFPNGAWKLIGRMSLTPYVAWVYRHVEAAGARHDSFPEELLVAVTPRIVWPDKPEISFGREFAVTLGQARSIASARSSTAVTLQGAYYWWGGYPTLLLGCALTGAGYALVWLLFRDQWLLNPVAAMACLALCHEGFRWFESAALGSFPLYFYLFIVFVPLQYVARRVLGYRPALVPAEPRTMRA